MYKINKVEQHLTTLKHKQEKKTTRIPPQTRTITTNFKQTPPNKNTATKTNKQTNEQKQKQQKQHQQQQHQQQPLTYTKQKKISEIRR